MADRRSLRKQNQLQNQPDPSPQSEPRGSVGRRDRNTGNVSANLDNGGTFQAKPLFKASVGSETEVQLNSRTKTADYKSSEQDKAKESGAKLDKPLPASGRPTPQFEELDDSENDPNNPFFGNCGGCNSNGSQRINCASGLTEIEFSDGSTTKVKTPALIEYGVKVKFNYQVPAVPEGETPPPAKNDELYAAGCPNFSIDDGLDDLAEPYPENVYGKLLYQQRASSVALAGATGSGLKEFQIYQNGCTVTVVGITEEGSKSVLGTTQCDELAGTYGVLQDKNCIILGDERRCGVDLDSLEFFCAVRVYRICASYRVQWIKESDGQIAYAQSCDQLGYRVELVEDVEPVNISGDPLYGRLKYDSGIPRSFVVNGDGYLWRSDNEYGYFQIYQDAINPCLYRVVGWKDPQPWEISAILIDGTIINESNTAGESQVVYAGSCGFEITLGSFVYDTVLRIYNAKGEVAYETSDFVAGSVRGCTYLGKDANQIPRFQNNFFPVDNPNNYCRGPETNVLILEKKTPTEETAILVQGIACVEETEETAQREQNIDINLGGGN